MNDIIEYRERFASLNPTFRVGIVQAQDTAHAKVRVVFPDYDEMISWWLPVVFFKTQDDKALANTGKLIIDIVSFTTTAGTFRSDLIGGVVPQVPNDGFYWMAIGF
jgi:hypothetical protein